VADRIVRHAVEYEGSDGDHFEVLGHYLGDSLWADVIEATGRLLEICERRPVAGVVLTDR